jgi:mRNA-degrading endonuclease RelE of RelBE toxin-antitoxin system
MKSAFLIVCLSISVLTGGCAELQGKSVKTYQLQYNAAVQASMDALENLEMSILNKKVDELGTEILARRADGTPVTVEVERVDRNFTRVAVGTGTGVARYLDKTVSEQIQEFIRKQLTRPSEGIQQPES